jgi:penicillin-insensitive murein endopeptidase
LRYSIVILLLGLAFGGCDGASHGRSPATAPESPPAGSERPEASSDPDRSAKSGVAAETDATSDKDGGIDGGMDAAASSQGGDGGRAGPDAGAPDGATEQDAPEGPGPEAILEMKGARSTSLGAPNNGKVEGAVPVPMHGPGFRYNPRRRPEARYGTVEVVQALIRAARVVEQEMPGGELTINDLSLKEGGPIAHHGSHQSGRDADTLFYLRDKNGNPHPSVGAPLDPQGKGVDFKNLATPKDDVPVRIDLPRTWRFVQALLADPEARVQRIFVVEHLRSMLLQQARKSDAPRSVVRKFKHVTCQPSYPHDDHFHIRFFCTPQDLRQGCEDSLPIYAWHRRFLRKKGVEPVVTERPPKPSPEITTHEEAREEAGPMHERVKEFLERREAWLDKPHPGRPYCP